jgi:hypothetical protein
LAALVPGVAAPLDPPPDGTTPGGTAGDGRTADDVVLPGRELAAIPARKLNAAIRASRPSAPTRNGSGVAGTKRATVALKAARL